MITKAQAFAALGGRVKDVAAHCRLTPGAVSQWPESLGKDQEDRVQAALWRMQESRKRKPLCFVK
jgi:hypothetical protein